MISLNVTWEEFLKIIKQEAGSQVVETWFKAVTLEQSDTTTSTAYLCMPNQFVNNWIKQHYTDLLKKHLSRLLGVPDIHLKFSCIKTRTSDDSSIIPAHSLREKNLPRTQTDNAVARTEHPPKNSLVSKIREKKEKQQNLSGLNISYQFDNFVVGPSNSLAQAAIYAIAQAPLGTVYNPLFIYGGTGLGKTHLLHAVGNEIKRKNPRLRISYETADHFMNEFINAIRFDKSPRFREKFNNLDLLLLDDVQFFSNKEQTQETFFHIFNSLHAQNKQIVLSSDTYPHEIKGLPSRLKSRMSWGLNADIQVPDLETKIAILKKKAEVNQLTLPDDVATYLASRVVSNIRELEGSLIRVGAFASLTNNPITKELAERVLLNTTEEKKEGIMLNKVLSTVAHHYNISVHDLKSKKRHKNIAFVRQVAFYMMKKLSFCSLSAIGSYVGGRDHSTVIHAVTKIEHQLTTDTVLAGELKTVEQEIIAN